MVTDRDRSSPVAIQYLDEFNVVVEGHRWFFPVVQQWNFCQPTSEFYVVKRLSRDGVNKRHFIVGFVVLYYHRAFTSILDYCHLNGFDLGFFDRDRRGKYPVRETSERELKDIRRGVADLGEGS